MSVLVLSDIHGNLSALKAVLRRAEQDYEITACILLGDLVDYGMHSNQVIEMIQCMPYEILCSIRGNHEDAVLHREYARFSSDRGRDSARYTERILTEASRDYLSKRITAGGQKEFVYNGKRCLAVHGSKADEYWKSIEPEDRLEEYSGYDYVFSGHSHRPHMFERYYACEDSRRRNKKKVIFINPGSVGQPRNLNPMAQFVVLDMKKEQINFEKTEYDIDAEQAAFCGQTDDFYCERLRWGI